MDSFIKKNIFYFAFNLILLCRGFYFLYVFSNVTFTVFAVSKKTFNEKVGI